MTSNNILNAIKPKPLTY